MSAGTPAVAHLRPIVVSQPIAVSQPIVVNARLLNALFGTGVRSGTLPNSVKIESIQSWIQPHIVTIFSKSYCPYCHRVKQLFTKLQLAYTALELDEHENEVELQQELKTLTGQTTVPNVFIGTKSIGGCDATYAQFASGALYQRLVQSSISFVPWTPPRYKPPFTLLILNPPELPDKVKQHGGITHPIYQLTRVQHPWHPWVSRQLVAFRSGQTEMYHSDAPVRSWLGLLPDWNPHYTYYMYRDSYECISHPRAVLVRGIRNLFGEWMPAKDVKRETQRLGLDMVEILEESQQPITITRKTTLVTPSEKITDCIAMLEAKRTFGSATPDTELFTVTVWNSTHEPNLAFEMHGSRDSLASVTTAAATTIASVYNGPKADLTARPYLSTEWIIHWIAESLPKPTKAFQDEKDDSPWLKQFLAYHPWMLGAIHIYITALKVKESKSKFHPSRSSLDTLIDICEDHYQDGVLDVMLAGMLLPIYNAWKIRS